MKPCQGCSVGQKGKHCPESDGSGLAPVFWLCVLVLTGQIVAICYLPYSRGGDGRQTSLNKETALESHEAHITYVIIFM